MDFFSRVELNTTVAWSPFFMECDGVRAENAEQSDPLSA